MDNRLKMAEAYYAVANDMKFQGERMLEIANVLGTMADSLCEANMREKKPDSASDKP